MEPEKSPLSAAHTNDGFFKNHLPAGIVTRIDWPSLMVLPGSFVKSSLQQVHSDLLFSVHIGTRETLL